jgi:hypothetical protein
VQDAESKSIRFYQLLELQLNNQLKKFLFDQLTPNLMREIRESIRSTINDVFSKSRHGLSSNAVTWLTDQYFKGIRLNDDQLMNDQVVINEYKLSELEFNDIQLLRNLFLETSMGPELDAELRRRNAS